MMIQILKKTILHQIAQRLNFLSSTKQVDLICILCLGYIVLLTRIVFLENYAQFMYNFDSYGYFYTAISSLQHNNFPSNPFVIFLLAISSLSDSENALSLARIVGIVFSIQLVLIFYLIARKMFNQIISFMGALMASFTTLFLSYSVTVHDDIFALSLGFTALYFSIRPQRLLHVVLASILIIITGLTRADAVMILIIPFGIGLSHYISKKINKNFFVVTGIFLAILLVVAYVGFQEYYHHITRFNIIEKLTLFFTYDNIKLVWQQSAKITNDDTLNNLFLGIILIGMVLCVYDCIKRHQILRQLNDKSSQSFIALKRMINSISVKRQLTDKPSQSFIALKRMINSISVKRQLNDKSSQSLVTGIYLIIAFLLNILFLAVFHIDYSIVNGVVVMVHDVDPRYLIGSQILLVYGFTYALSLFIHLIYPSLRGTLIEVDVK